MASVCSRYNAQCILLDDQCDVSSREGQTTKKLKPFIDLSKLSPTEGKNLNYILMLYVDNTSC